MLIRLNQLAQQVKIDGSQRRGSRKAKKNKDREKEKDETSSNDKANYRDIIGTLVASKFRLLRMLGSGSYGKSKYLKLSMLVSHSY